jgi:hypothetical protein
VRSGACESLGGRSYREGDPDEHLFPPPQALTLKLLDTPTRVYDSRSKDGPLGTNQSRNITVTGTFNGIDVPPQSTAAVLCNLTAVTPSGVGYLVMLKPGAGYAGTSNVDFIAGQIISNVSCGVYGYRGLSTAGCGSDAAGGLPT